MYRIFKLFLSFIVIFIAVQTAAQNPYLGDGRILMTVGDTPVTVEEFMNVYLKNNQREDILDKKTIDEYIKMYAEFKFKVNEAKANHLDTSSAFREELAGYRKDLSNPYFSDESVIESLMEEAYQRMQEDIRASHILILCNEDASPKDTLAAYKKIEGIRKRIEKGEDFGTLAATLSDDPSARDQEGQGGRPGMKGNKGDLGYFTVFNMIYPFESAVYATPNQTLSPIVRTSFGYHLIKVTDRQPAMGRAQVAHVFFQLRPEYTQNQKDSLLNRADEVYKKLQEGGNWATIVREYSDDKSTAMYDGVLPWFTSSRMVPEFIATVHQLKEPGDISTPVETDLGYHIIRLEGKKPIGAYEEEKQDIRTKVLRDSRSKRSTESVISKIKKEYSYSDDHKNLKKFQAACGESLLSGNWDATQALQLDLPLFTIGDSILTTDQFVDFITRQQKKEATRNNPAADTETVETLTARYFKLWSDETCLAYEDNRLEKKHPEFRLLLKEYRDGILLYEMIEKEVWGRSTSDTSGLEAFFAQNRDKYYWKERRDYLEMTVSGFASQEEAKKAEKKIVKMVKKDAGDEKIKAAFASNEKIYFFIYHRKAEKGAEKKLDALWDVALPYLESEVLDNNIIKIFKINKILPPEPKELDETRGSVIIDYQEFLEKEWIEKLHKKYTINVNQEVLNSIKK